MVSLGPHCVCRFHTEDYLVRSVSLKHPTLVYSNPLLPLCLLHALHIVCDILFSRMLVICTNACHMHACRMPVICTYACHMHVCLPNARMPDICTYACKIHVFLPYVRTTYAYHMHVCLTYERMPDVCTYTVYLIYARMHAKVCKDSGVQADRLSRTFRRFS